MSLYTFVKNYSCFATEETQAHIITKNLQKHIQVFWFLKYVT